MKMSSPIVILITLIVSTSYIFGIDYYDKKEVKIKEIYRAISLPQITYSQISIELNGIKEGESLDARDIAEKQQQSIDELSHLFSCSKLCTQVHSSDAETELIKEKDTIGILSESKDKETAYSVLIKNQKSINYNTFYKIKIQGLKDTQQLDNLRNRAFSLFRKWHINSEESLAFKGSVEGNLTLKQRKIYVKRLFKVLKAAERGHYLDDYGKNTEAYYGYTKIIKSFTRDAKGQKNNLQISFVYNEEEDITQIIIAFPFYNEPF